MLTVLEEENGRYRARLWYGDIMRLEIHVNATE